ncbi:MAG: protein phosphatase 2C domain-containing protein [Kofleriaceae bacterium]|nr:protein phosphatase 2C domain-containing protein [Kofleriaceae bacterium]
MNTISAVRAGAAAVSGARHLRAGRNGQDAVATWTGAHAGVVVVCDGCGSGASSEVGARLGAQLMVRAVTARLLAGELPSDRGMWDGARRAVANVLGLVAEAMPGERELVVHEHFLFTVVAAAVGGDEVAVWALGDGAYQLGERTCVLGPFQDNQPPYLAYDLLGTPPPAHLEVAPASVGRVLVATDGVAEMGLDVITPNLRHPDALRRQLSLLARGSERIDWDAGRVVRTPAALQDDGAVAVMEWVS